VRRIGADRLRDVLGADRRRLAFDRFERVERGRREEVVGDSTARGQSRSERSARTPAGKGAIILVDMTTLDDELAALRKSNDEWRARWDASQARVAEVEAALAASASPPGLAELHEMAEQWLNANMGDHWSPQHFDELVAMLQRVATPNVSAKVEPRASTTASEDDEVWLPDGEGGFVRTKVRSPTKAP